GTVYFAQLNPDRKIDWREIRGRLHAFAADTGKELWSRPCASWGWGHPADVFAVHGLVWVHSYEGRPRRPRQCRPRSARDLPDTEARIRGSRVLGLDPATGEIRREFSNLEAFDNGHHHRCYRNKATTRWLMTSYRGLEFLSWDGDTPRLNHWVRGTCRLGAFACNGLVYATPHPCNCYITAKLNGFLALAPLGEGREARDEGRAEQTPRLERGPAYESPLDTRHSTLDTSAWPTYRHDPQRSGSTPEALGGELEPAWTAEVGGRPSACTVAGGKVFVASVPTHEVCAFDAGEGEPAWRFTAGGPVDTPPTICGGLAIFGCADGWVYAVRATDGALAWRFRAAPAERLVGAFGHLGSAWPLHGSVLARDGRVYAVAGRSSFLDGGLYASCLEAQTGKVLAEENLATRHDMDVDIGRNQADYHGTLPDILAADGDTVRMRGLPLFGDLDRGTKASSSVLRPTAGFLDGSWFNRTHWFLDGKPLGELLVHDDRAVYGVKAYPTLNANSGFHKPGAKGYSLFARERRARTKKGRRWSVRLPVRVTSMVLARPSLVVAGTPDILVPDDPWAAYQGRRGGVLMALSAANGSTLCKRKLDAAPVYDGLAAANGRLYLATQDGRLHCFATR
ncbi:MAG: PQQ-binding-like beta-propeller repeat protein, partial [Planctomycetota bacterium]